MVIFDNASINRLLYCIVCVFGVRNCELYMECSLCNMLMWRNKKNCKIAIYLEQKSNVYQHY
jgi:hypothetical protein